VVAGSRVVAVENDFVIIDVGLKTEGRVALKEFSQPGKDVAIKAGDTVEVYLERIENALGEAVLSRDKARREEAWTRLEEMSGKNERVDGVIFASRADSPSISTEPWPSCQARRLTSARSAMWAR
jgi:small subunit ribosomal protein S1